MPKIGLIGYPLDHSFSADYFREKFEKENIKGFQYNTYPLKSIKDLTKLLKKETDLVGLNVTTPYKQDVLPFLYEIDPEAVEVWAVNTIKVSREKGRTLLKGYNTDWSAFSHSISPLLQKQHKKALLFGTGGAASAARVALEKLGLSVTHVSRKPKLDQITYADIDSATLFEYKVLVNATPIGTFPKVNEAPDLPYDQLSSMHLCYDMVYNPSKSLFLNRAEERGALIKNGHEMLSLQAEASWEIWNGLKD